MLVVSLLLNSVIAIIANDMNQESVIADIESRARRAGVSIRALCLRAQVHPVTFSKWKRSARNPDPMSATLNSIGRLYDALQQIEDEHAAECRKARKAVGA